MTERLLILLICMSVAALLGGYLVHDLAMEQVARTQDELRGLIAAHHLVIEKLEAQRKAIEQHGWLDRDANQHLKNMAAEWSRCVTPIR